MTDIRHRKADKVRPTGEVVVQLLDHTAILSFLPSTNDNIPYNNPSETACSKRAFHWLGFSISRESFAHQRVIYRSICIKSQSPSELSWTLLWTDLGYFLRNGKKKKKRKEKEKEKNVAQLELKIVYNIALWLRAGLQHTKLRNIVSYKTHNHRQVKNVKLKIYL